jgi:hypothetical protein
MTLERFCALADAYGGVIARWPEDQRDAAMRFAADPAAVTILQEASAVDTMLDAWSVPAPVSSLSGRIAGHRAMPHRSPAGRVRLWWSGIGIAAALAGAASGTAAVATVSPGDAPQENVTSFGAVDLQEG